MKSNQEKALVGVFSVIIQQHQTSRKFVSSSSEEDDLYQDVGHMGSSVIVSRGSGGVPAQQARCDDSV